MNTQMSAKTLLLKCKDSECQTQVPSPHPPLTSHFNKLTPSPAGVNRHFHMICIRDKFSQNIGRQVPSKVIWDHLSTMYDMQALVSRNRRPQRPVAGAPPPPGRSWQQCPLHASWVCARPCPETGGDQPLSKTAPSGLTRRADLA